MQNKKINIYCGTNNGSNVCIYFLNYTFFNLYKVLCIFIIITFFAYANVIRTGNLFPDHVVLLIYSICLQTVLATSVIC